MDIRLPMLPMRPYASECASHPTNVHCAKAGGRAVGGARGDTGHYTLGCPEHPCYFF